MPRTQPLTLSGDEVRTLLGWMRVLLTAVEDGQVTFDGQPVPGMPRPPVHVVPQEFYKPTIQELRARQTRQLPDPILTDDARTIDSAPMPRRQSNPRPTPAKIPRKVYELAVPNGRKLDLDGLSAAGVAIIKYLSVHGTGTIFTFMNEFSLSRAHVANTLTTLRKRKLVASRNV